LVFAVEPAKGRIRWVKCLNSSPSEFSGLDYECFDLLFREGDGIAMSRWLFDRAGGALTVKRHEGFARLDAGGGAVMVPRGCWSYAPKEVERRGPDTLGQSLVVFRDHVLLGCAPKKQGLYRRDFQLETGEQFDSRWPLRYEIKWPSEILSAKSAWQVSVFGEASPRQTIRAMALAADRLYLAGSEGDLQVRAMPTAACWSNGPCSSRSGTAWQSREGDCTWPRVKASRLSRSGVVQPERRMS